MSTRPVIVYPDASSDEKDLYSSQFERLDSFSDFRLFTGRPESMEEYVDRIKDARGILLGWDLPREVMRQAHHLEIVSFSGIGAAKFVDIDQANERGIVVSNCPGYSDNTVAEHALALLLALARHLTRLDKDLRSGFWNQGLSGMELRGKQIGLIGFGGIGARFAQLCQALGMKVKVWARNMPPERAESHNVEFIDLDHLYAESDVISLHLASTPETRELIDDFAFRQMKPGALLINTARGELIDENALIHALESGRLGGAALDVFTEEPLPSAHPFTQLGNVVLSPHIAYHTPEATQTLFNIAVENLVSFFQGNPINQVTSST